MTLPQNAAELFETWIPARFAEFLTTSTGQSVRPNEHCTVNVQVAKQCWSVGVKNRVLQVSASTPEAPASFRLQVDPATLKRFVLSELAHLPPIPADVPASSPLLKLLNLDDEALALVQGIPGSVKLVVRDGETRYTASLGPGSQPLAPAACTVSCALEDAELLRTGKAQPMELFFGGRIQLEGDPQAAMGLAGLFL